MKRTLLSVLLVLAVFALPACFVVGDPGGVDQGFDFNGVWSFAITGCQRQLGDVTIAQSGYNFAMTSTDLGWTGACDPFAETFEATAQGGWGYWTFHGQVTGDNSLGGTYLYVEYGRGDCTGSFDAVRTAFRAAGEAAGAPLARVR